MNLVITSASTVIYSPRYSFFYLYQFYYLYFCLYFSKVLDSVSSFINIKIAIDRYIYLKKKKVVFASYLNKTDSKNTKIIKIYIISFFMLSFIYFLPNLIFFKISPSNFNTKNFTVVSRDYRYKIVLRDFVSNNKYLSIALQGLHCFKNLTSLILMTVVNALTYTSINRRYKDYLSSSLVGQLLHPTSRNGLKKNLVLNHKLKRIGEKTSLIVLWASLLFIINELVTGTGFVMFIFQSYYKKTVYNYILVGTAIIISITYVTTCSFNMFIYKKFNKTFSLKFQKIIFRKYSY